MTLHRQLLDAAVQRFAPRSDGLRGAAICITGASGFMAASLLAFLSELDRFADLKLRLYANARRPESEVRLLNFLRVAPEVEWTRSSVEDIDLPAADGLIVIHTASYGSPKDYLREPLATFSANTHALVRLLTQDRTLRQFVYFSSAEVYGQPPPDMIPTPESYIGGVSTVEPRSIYAESKRMGEVLAVSTAQRRQLPLTIIRPWNVYGPGQRLDDGRVPVEFIRQAKEGRRITLTSNGTPQRAFCHAWDAVAQIAATLGNPAPAAAFNVGNPSEEISILDLARACAAACELPPDAVHYDREARSVGLSRCAPNVDAALRQSGMPAAFTPLDSGLRTLIEWYDFRKR